MLARASDWAIDFAMARGSDDMRVTVAHGSPYASFRISRAMCATLAEATRFTREKDLVTLPDAPVKIILMPEFRRGVSVAYCDSPGPLDKGLATYYAVSPIPEDWTDTQVDSFLREYNTRMLHLLSIHEAMPSQVSRTPSGMSRRTSPSA